MNGFQKFQCPANEALAFRHRRNKMAIQELYTPQLYLILENNVPLLHLFHKASFQKTLQ